MSDFNHTERLSRQEAAERLIDIAYALTAGGPLELSAAGRRITVPVTSELRLERRLNSNGDRLVLALDLTWPVPEAERIVTNGREGRTAKPASAADSPRRD